jgi:lysophospholipase L1-like esterase
MRERGRTQINFDRLGKGLFLSFLTLGAIVLALEIWLRATTPVLFSKGVFRNDPLLSYRVQPVPGFSNSLGFRDDEFTLEKPPGTFRIVALGDSFAFGAQVPFEDNFLYLLEGELARGRVEVMNLGVPGYGVGDEYKLLMNLGFQYQPDVVILCFFVGNDFEGNGPPRQGDLLNFAHPIAIDGRPQFVDERLAAMVDYHNWFLLKYLDSFRLTVNMSRALAREKAAGKETGTFPEDFFLETEYRRSRIYRRDDPYLQEQWSFVQMWVLAMRDETEKRGGKFVFVVIPDQIQVEPALRERVLTRYNLERQRYDFERPQTLLGQFAAAEGIAVLDLLPLFRREGQQGGLYKLNDSHWNTAGNQLAAEAISEFITPMLPAESIEEPG